VRKSYMRDFEAGVFEVVLANAWRFYGNSDRWPKGSGERIWREHQLHASAIRQTNQAKVSKFARSVEADVAMNDEREIASSKRNLALKLFGGYHSLQKHLRDRLANWTCVVVQKIRGGSKRNRGVGYN